VVPVLLLREFSRVADPDSWMNQDPNSINTSTGIDAGTGIEKFLSILVNLIGLDTGRLKAEKKKQ